MKKLPSILSVTLVFAFTFSNAHAGAAMCVATEKTPKKNVTDVQYFTRWNSSDNGYKVEKRAREDYKRRYSRGYPACRSTGRIMHGHFVVLKNTMRNYAKELKTTYAFGYGDSPREAEHDAVREMRRRNWSWKKQDGYRIVDSRRF